MVSHNDIIFYTDNARLGKKLTIKNQNSRNNELKGVKDVVELSLTSSTVSPVTQAPTTEPSCLEIAEDVLTVSVQTASGKNIMTKCVRQQGWVGGSGG